MLGTKLVLEASGALGVIGTSTSTGCASGALHLARDATLEITVLSVERSSIVGRSLPVI